RTCLSRRTSREKSTDVCGVRMAQGRRAEAQSQCGFRGGERAGRPESYLDLRVCGVRGLGGGTARGRDGTESLAAAKAQPLRAQARTFAKTLVRHHARSRTLVQAAGGGAGRSVTELK